MKRLMLVAVAVLAVGCDGGERVIDPCAAHGDVAPVVAAGDMPRAGFMLVDGYLCYAPRGTIRQETCTQYELHRVCTPKAYTYCPSWKATVSTGVDPLEVRARLYCGADRLPTY